MKTRAKVWVKKMNVKIEDVGLILIYLTTTMHKSACLWLHNILGIKLTLEIFVTKITASTVIRQFLSVKKDKQEKTNELKQQQLLIFKNTFMYAKNKIRHQKPH
jgi:hypothetical protein